MSAGDVMTIGYDLSGRIRGATPSISTAEWSSTPSGLTFSSETISDLIVTTEVDTSSALSNRTYIATCTYTDSEGNTSTVKAKLRVLGSGELT
jgi:hypothetical protein